jgi:predicted flap endonuclease-1-like 5' DNA nuclease
MSQAEAVDVVLSSYGDDDADDPVVRVESTGVEPTVDIDDFTSARQGTVVVQGTTNLANGNTVDLRLRSGGGRAPFIRQATATVAGRRWSAPFDLSNVETGQYTVTASAGSASDQQAFTLLPRGTGPVIRDDVIRDDIVRDDAVRDDFTVISGIGEARAEALDTAGFHTMGDVAEANPRELADELGISTRLAREIVREADERRRG